MSVLLYRVDLVNDCCVIIHISNMDLVWIDFLIGKEEK